MLCLALQSIQTRVHGIASNLARADLLAAVAADAVGPLLDAPQSLFDCLEDLGVSLLQLELYVDFVVAAGLIGQVPLAAVRVSGCSGLIPPVARIAPRLRSNASL